MGEIRSVTFTQRFDEQFRKIARTPLRERLEKQVSKIMRNPELGKPLRYYHRGDRTTYVKPYRLIYRVEGDALILINFQHRKEVYRA